MHHLVCLATCLWLVLLSPVQSRAIETNVPANISVSDGGNVNGSTKCVWNPCIYSTLRVALFPYIPDSNEDNFEGLRRFIKREFETQYPGYILELEMNKTTDFYNLTILKNMLAEGPGGYDVVEIDTVFLGDLVDAALVSPQTIPPDILADLHPASVTAVQLNQASYGFPHLLCAFFLMTRGSSAAQARTIGELVAALGSAPSSVYRIVGNLDSSWSLPALRIDSIRDTFYSASQAEAEALHDPGKYRFDAMRQLARLCDLIGGRNPCLDGTFRNSSLVTNLFSQGFANAMFGYSERLYDVMKNGLWNDINNVKAIPIPLGNYWNDPVFFTDAFVFRRHMASNAVRFGAELFARFMATPRMQAVLAGSGDATVVPRIPRYLLPVSKMAYDDPLLASNPFYRDSFRKLNGVSYPNTGFANGRHELRSIILAAIRSEVAKTSEGA